MLVISQAVSAQENNWKEFFSSYKNYIRNPTVKNAIKAYNDFPCIIEIKDEPGKNLSDSINRYLNEFENLIDKKDRNALSLAFRIHTIEDGEFEEGLNISVANLIIKDPQLFLDELNNFQIIIHDINTLVLSTDPNILNYKDIFKERISSLQTVDKPELNSIKNQCIYYLRKSL